MPVGHRHDVFYAGVAQSGGRAQAVAVERVEMRVEPLFARGFDEQRQVVAPVAGDHRVGAACADFGNVRREVLHAAGGDEFVGDDRNVRAALLQRALGFTADVVAEAVVLVEQIDFLHRFILLDDIGERVHAHAGVGIEAEMPEAAIRVGERGVVGGIIEEHHAVLRIAGILLVDRVDERRGNRRAIALHDKANILVDGRTQLDETGFAAALAVEDHELQRVFAIGQGNATVRVHALHAEAQIALNSRARVRERTGHAFDHRDANGRQTGSGVRRTRGSNHRAANA